MPHEGDAVERLFAGSTLAAARGLLGALLHLPDATVRVVETEAYTDDAASHHVTRPRTGRLLGTSHGLVYVYTIYGMHRCLNVTTDAAGPGAVLFRAVEPVRGLDALRARRPGRPDRELANGPGKLFVALGIDPALHGRPFTDAFRVELPRTPPPIACGPRIGISKARELPWRFWIDGSPWAGRGGSARRS